MHVYIIELTNNNRVVYDKIEVRPPKFTAANNAFQ